MRENESMRRSAVHNVDTGSLQAMYLDGYQAGQDAQSSGQAENVEDPLWMTDNMYSDMDDEDEYVSQRKLAETFGQDQSDLEVLAACVNAWTKGWHDGAEGSPNLYSSARRTYGKDDLDPSLWKRMTQDEKDAYTSDGTYPKPSNPPWGIGVPDFQPYPVCDHFKPGSYGADPATCDNCGNSQQDHQHQSRRRTAGEGDDYNPEGMPPLQLSGVDGNAFNVLGLAQQVAREAGWDDEKISEFMAEATAGDYDHLLQTCMKYFDVS